MRKLLLLLALFFTLNSAAQTRKYYAELWIFENHDVLIGLINKSLFGIRAIMDVNKANNGLLCENDSVELVFDTTMEPVNYLAERGWSVIAVPSKDLPFTFKAGGLSGNYPNMTHYIMCKEATSLDEAMQGLKILHKEKPLPEPKKPRVKKEVKDGKTYYKFNKERN